MSKHERHGLAQGPVNLTVYSREHNRLNLQDVDSVVAALERTVSVEGNNTVYIEAANLETNFARKQEKFVREYGYPRFLIAGALQTSLGRRAYDYEIDRTSERIRALDNFDEIEEMLQRYDMNKFPLSNYFIGLGIERLSQEIPLQIQFEAHSKKTLAQYESILKRANQAKNQSLDFFGEGDADNSLIQFKRHHVFMVSHTGLREREIERDLLKLAGNAGEKGGGSIFFPVGAAHAFILHEFETRLKTAVPGSHMEFIYPDEVRFSFTAQMLNIMIREGTPDIELHIKAFLESMSSIYVRDFYRGGRAVDALCRNWTSIQVALYKTISEIPHDRLRDAVIKGSEEYKEFMGNIYTNAIGPYINQAP